MKNKIKMLTFTTVGSLFLTSSVLANGLTPTYALNFRLNNPEQTTLATGIVTKSFENIKDNLIPISADTNTILDKGILLEEKYKLNPIKSLPTDVLETELTDKFPTMTRDEILTVVDEMYKSYNLDLHQINYDYDTIINEFKNGNVSLELEPLKEVIVKEGNKDNITFSCSNSQFEIIDNDLIDLNYK